MEIRSYFFTEERGRTRRNPLEAQETTSSKFAHIHCMIAYGIEPTPKAKRGSVLAAHSDRGLKISQLEVNLNPISLMHTLVKP